MLASNACFAKPSAESDRQPGEGQRNETCGAATGIDHRDGPLRVPNVGARQTCHSTREIFSLDRLHVSRFMPLNDAAMNCHRGVWVNSREQTRVNSRER
jgi:hypothetical protein